MSEDLVLLVDRLEKEGLLAQEEYEKLVDIVSAIRKRYPDCAITLSLGERSRKSYEALYLAGTGC